MDIYDYARLSKEKKQELLRDEGVVLEVSQEKEDVTYVYILCNFFVEVTMRDGEEVDNIPYKRGFKKSPAHKQAA